ncbi:DUF333 domain-containing protein [Candidatus Micrarchaeota archaeon]|nr:DUF333 domain-containing protein [Candidatus Micrarchaeota archaeon]
MYDEPRFKINWKALVVLIAVAVSAFFIYDFWRSSQQKAVEEIGSCELSLCDCKCYLKGSTPEAVEGKACDLDCAQKFRVAGCELKNSACVELKARGKSFEETAITNPASEKCIAQGFQLDLRENESSQFGVCVFPDGSECEEWAFYRGECKFEKQE